MNSLTTDTDVEQVIIPGWLRVVDLLVGALSIAFFVLVGLMPSNVAIIILLTIALFMVGLARFARAAAVRAKGTPRRVVNLAAGLLGIGAASLIIFNISLPEGYLVIILGIAWMVMGLARILIGIIEKDVFQWARILQLVIGLATVALTSLVLVYSATDFSAIAMILLIIVIANGFARTSRAYVGV
ncbi:MAG: hypothetical protein JSW61_03380 [Candidatus Thorarchaeota archaeon]|nr:MAG: hypothetical protein JSW61_03380 [Candidatus Thorarchaeota archaeon]